MRRAHVLLLFLFPLTMAVLPGCSPNGAAIKPVERVDLRRFMGDWYVIAHIPSFVERNAYDAVESYALMPDGTVQTTFHYRNGSFTAPLHALHPTAYIETAKGNAVWRMQFVWPIKAQYVIAYIDPEYQQTIIARDVRDYVWIMARSPSISTEDYAKLVGKVVDLGYSADKLRTVPQRAELQR